MQSLQKLWRDVKSASQKLQQLLDYEKQGLLTEPELERLVDEQQLENSLSACCGGKINIFGFCEICWEHS